MRTIWITGAGGLIGSYLARTAPRFVPPARVVALARGTLDLANSTAVRSEFYRQKPELIVHCAGMSQSPECQANPTLARKLNVEVTALLAELAVEARLIFLSTDLVFDGRTGNYDESAVPNPLNIYAETKVEAERMVLANPNHTVVRTSLNGGISPTGDRGFNERFYNAWREGKLLSLFADEYRSPICAEVTAHAIWELASQGKPGLYHVAGSERLSRWQIGELLAARHPELKPRIERSSLKEYSGAPRSPDTSLNCGKLQSLLSFPLPRFTAWLGANPSKPF